MDGHGVTGVHGVRYQVTDVARAVTFYPIELFEPAARSTSPAVPERKQTKGGGGS
jgi:hypothetical protein